MDILMLFLNIWNHSGNDVHNLSDITNLQSKIYHKIYLGIVYIANEAYLK